MALKWQIQPSYDREALNTISSSRAVRQLLYNRNLTHPDEARRFLKPQYAHDLHDPFLFHDMETAVRRVLDAIDQEEGIAIHGDYDADGVCASAIIASALEFLGTTAYVHLPHRMRDGYGLKLSAVDTIAAQGATLLITADCGIANAMEIAYAAERGIDTIIVDHHQAPATLPSAHAIIHCDLPDSTYPFRRLSAGGVAFKFVQALLHTARLTRLALTERDVEAFEKWLLDLVAISTVADVMPLVGENRVLVQFGLQVLGRTRRLGLRQLMRIARIAPNTDRVQPLTVRNIAYHLAPRLNAAGRMAHASLSYYLMQSQDEIHARVLAEQLDAANRSRQRATEEMVSHAHTQIRLIEGSGVIVVFSPDWSVGLVGLVAGKLAEHFQKPAFVIGRTEGKWTGSCRGAGIFHCVHALERVAHLLDRWGGHAQAAGFTLRDEVDPQLFRTTMDDAYPSLSITTPTLAVDAEVSFSDLDNEAFIDTLPLFAPFGEGNPAPLFCTRNVAVMRVELLGKDGRHMKCLVRDRHNIVLPVLFFDYRSSSSEQLREGVMIDIVYEPVLNTWNGTTSLELYARDYHIVS